MKHMIDFIESAIEYNKRTEELLQTILNEVKMKDPESIKEFMSEHSHDLEDRPRDARAPGSMQMVEAILGSQKSSGRTIEFVTGLRNALNNRGTLSESQRHHLESTYKQFRNNTES